MPRRPNQQPLGNVERVLFRTYVNCPITIAHPRDLYQELDLTQEQLAIIAGCSLTTMERWLSQEREPRMLK
jgi:DNA-binding transcriptional regulator YiaG